MRRIGRKMSGLALGLVSLALVGCEKPVEPTVTVRPVKTIVIGESGQKSARSFPGTVRAGQQARLRFRVSGPLVELPISEGQRVDRGQLLARIDPRDFETQVGNLEARLAELNAQYKAMQMARPEDIRRLEAGLGAAQARLLEATASFRRAQRLYENQNISKAEYDQARAAREVAESEVASAEESLRIARSGARPEDLEAMEARIRAMEGELRLAGDRLLDTQLRAPYDGIVAERFVDNFEYINAFTDVVSLQNIEVVEIVAQIPETVVARAREGGTVNIKATFPSLPGVSLDAKMSEIAAQADPVTRTYAVTFQTTQPESARVLAGMTAEMQVSGEERESAGFLVPASAIFQDADGQSKVWVLDEGADTGRKVSVQLGEPSGDGIWVLSGLEPGMRIITAGAQFLTSDQQVRLMTDELRERR